MKKALYLTIAAFELAFFNVSTLMVEAQSYTNNYGVWGYTTTNGAVTITGYSGSGGVVTIPDTIDGLPVTIIGHGAFCYAYNLTSVTIPNTVTDIEDGWVDLGIPVGAFSGCISLTDVMIGNGVTNIGSWAFDSCTCLTSLVIPGSVTRIGDRAFNECANLTGIYFNGNAPSVGDQIGSAIVYYLPGTSGWTTNFAGLRAFLWDPLLQLAYTVNNGTVTIAGYTGSNSVVIIPDSINGLLVTTVGDWAFGFCNSLTSVTIPDSVTNIGDYAFDRCSSLTSVTIPDSVISIGDGAFEECGSLTRLTIPNSVKSIGSCAFDDCSSLTRITIPNSVTDIEDGWDALGDRIGAFSHCTSLTNVTIPNSVTHLGSWAFYVCPSLTSVTIPNSVTTIGDGAFESCANLTSIYFEGNAPNAGGYVFDGDDKATIYYLPGTTGWSTIFAGHPTALWVLPYPVILTTPPSFGVQTNGLGFTISWATNFPVVVEASATLANPVWSPISTNSLTSGTANFTDPEWQKYPGRFYRIRSL